MNCKLNSRELTSVLINLITVKMLFTYPRYLVERMENGAWISVALWGIVALGIFWLTQYVYLKTERMTILMQAEMLGGRILKAVTGIAIIILIMFNIAPMVRAFPEAIKTALLQNTPMLVIITILAVGVAIGARFGIEPLARVAAIFLPVACAFIVFFFLTLIPHYRLTNLFPISPFKVTIGGTSALSVFADIFVLNLLMPYAKDMNTVKKSGIAAIIIGGITGFLIVLAYCLTYLYPLTARFIVPMYQLARNLRIGTYFQRLESIFEFIWSISIFIYTSIYVFVICDVFRQSFNLKHYRPLVFPVLMILLRLVFWESGYVKAQQSNFVNSGLFYPIFYILPLLFGLFTIIKMKKRGRER